MQRPFKQRGDLNKINQDLSGLFSRLGLGKQLDAYKTMQLWQTAIDELYRSNAPQLEIAVLKSKTYAIKLNKNSELIVGVRSAALANELQFLKANLLVAFNRVCERARLAAVKGIIFELR